MAVAFIMPGQGSQSIGMGKSLYENFTSAKDVFNEVDDALNQKLSQLMFNGDIEELTLTYNAQPAIMTVSIAVIRVMESMGLDVSKSVSVMAGHSLGEYSALCAAGVYSLSDTARLLRARGNAMQNAVASGVGAMCAIIGLDIENIEQICFDVSRGDEICQIANDNGAGQVVISGHKSSVERAVELVKDAGAKRAVFLPVSAPFHCSLMQPAADIMKNELSNVKSCDPVVGIIPNINVVLQKDAKEIPDLLVQQVTGRVRWRETVQWFAENGIDIVYEIGWGKVLTNLVKRIDKNIQAETVYETTEIEKCVEGLC